MEAANWEDETGGSQVQGHPGQLCETLVITSIKIWLWIQFSDRELFYHTFETLDLIPSTRKEKDGEREKREGKEERRRGGRDGEREEKRREKQAERCWVPLAQCPLMMDIAQLQCHSQDADEDTATMWNISITSCIFLSGLSRSTPSSPHLFNLFSITTTTMLSQVPNSQGTGRLLGVPGQPGPHSTILSYKHKTITTKRPL